MKIQSMNLNNTLCKYCDADNKGYVTVGDIGELIFSVIIGLIICIGYLHFVKCGLIKLYEYFISKPETSLMTDFEMMSAPIGVMIIALTIIVAVIITIMCISDIKIATCKLKK